MPVSEQALTGLTPTSSCTPMPIAPTALGSALELLDDDRPVVITGNRLGSRRNGLKRRLCTYGYGKLAFVTLSLTVSDR